MQLHLLNLEENYSEKLIFYYSNPMSINLQRSQSLFVKMKDWARKRNLVRLELTTAINNERAFLLYKKMGFKVEGIKKKNILVDNVAVDEYQLSFIIPQNNHSSKQIQR